MNAEKYYGKKIANANFTDNEFIIRFEDGTKIKIFDGGQSCCEHRYMTCDDNTHSLKGKILVAIEEKCVENSDSESESHDIVFLDIKTNDNVVQFATHNEHNGYYGGFLLEIEEI